MAILQWVRWRFDPDFSQATSIFGQFSFGQTTFGSGVTQQSQSGGGTSKVPDYFDWRLSL